MGRRSHSAKCPYCREDHGTGAPFWNRSKNCWSIVVGRGRSRLLVKGWEGHDEAMRLWYETKATQSTGALDLIGHDGESLTIEYLCEAYLAFQYSHVQAKTAKNQRDTLTLFANDIGSLTVAQLRDGGVGKIRTWAVGKGWQQGMLGLVYAQIKAVFNWAEGEGGLISSSPIKLLNTGKGRVTAKSRVSVLSQAQEEVILDCIPKRGFQFRLALETLIGTGCRPEEFCTVTAADLRTDDQGSLYWYVKHKNQYKARFGGQRRPVYLLTAKLEELTREAAERNPNGPIFRNNWNDPWTISRLLEAFRRATARPACKKQGLDDHVIVKLNDRTKKEYRYVVYTCRHTFAHRYLTGFYRNENDDPIVLNYGQVADLMGNTAAEVERTYGHIELSTPKLVAGIKR